MVYDLDGEFQGEEEIKLVAEIDDETYWYRFSADERVERIEIIYEGGNIEVVNRDFQ